MASPLAAPLAAAIGVGVVSAFFYLAVLFGGFGALILGYLAPLPLFLAGLWLGSTASLLAGAAGTVAVLAVSSSVLVSLAYLVTAAVPVILVVRQALLARAAPDGGVEWYPPGRLLMALTGMGLAGLLGAAVLTLDQPGGLEGAVRETLGRMADQMFSAQGHQAPDPQDIWMAEVLPGFAVISWLVMTIVNGALAQGVLMRFGRNKRPAMRLDDLELPRWLATAFLLAMVTASLASDPVGFLAVNAALILALPFAFAGLSVVHVFARSRSAKLPILIGFYMFLFLFGWPIVLMVGLGMIEQWIGLRRRLRPAGPDQEDE
ncbi:DUF2232 domain-containing protein [Azospirillum brasilense]|uniref:DUF2232 domain-containing protein n=1 Tax=Azospirillum brasilense TaxID=192 RepID=A0A4D8QY72_AZOBR|nr:DUF2232 domain-containing protein [Azospirillum brasilense]QCO13914.1 DUF2232 domain-containing protein [Azospirillum brasilense]